MTNRKRLRATQIATEVELRAAREMLDEYFAELGIDLNFQDLEEELYGFPGEYAPPNGCLLMGRAEGRPVGIVAVRPWRGKTCELKRLFVAPDKRGRGYGRKLVEAAIAVAREMGYTAMRLDTLRRLGPSLRLYEALGFHGIPAYRENPCEDAVFLELSLI